MTENSNFKLCILAAGLGTRNTTVPGLHKALLPVENKAAISHIIKSVSEDVGIVIAIGYKAQQVETYVRAIFPNRSIEFVMIDNYDGPGSGPGQSLLECKDYLQTPFIFTSADTIVEETHKLQRLQENWVGASGIRPECAMNYCLIKGEKYLEELYYGSGTIAYNGIAGIYDYKKFWKSLEEHKKTNKEFQVIHGFEGLSETKLYYFTWHDTGNNEAYKATRQAFSDEIVAPKNEEVIFIDQGHVIKYFSDKEKVEKRVKRVDFLNRCAPEVTTLNENMYTYPYINGDLLSNILEESVLKGAVSFFIDRLGSQQLEKTPGFIEDCKKMYETKALKRIEYFVGSDLDKATHINGVAVESITELLAKVDWERVYDLATPTRFHGDFQPENIIYDGSTYHLIDWRESFGDSLEVGDLYYDLGKLYHALLINGQMVLGKEYRHSIRGNKAYLQYNGKSNLLFLLNYLEDYCIEHGLNWENVVLLGILQYIGISSLYKEFHDGRYGEFLFLLGKYLLTKKINKERNE